MENNQTKAFAAKSQLGLRATQGVADPVVPDRRSTPRATNPNRSTLG